MLQGKTVLLGVTGSIAAYKTASLASTLKKEGCSVHVIMTKNATEFITPLTFETLTGNRCITDTFDRSFEFKVGHVSLGKLADLVLIAPASADVIAKLAAGITDTAVTMAAKAHLRNGRPVVVAVSSNDGLAAGARNIGELLARKHYYFVPFGQDSAEKKPSSLVADFSRIPDTVDAALEGRQLQPVLLR